MFTLVVTADDERAFLDQLRELEVVAADGNEQMVDLASTILALCADDAAQFLNLGRKQLCCTARLDPGVASEHTAACFGVIRIRRANSRARASQ